MFMTGNGWAWQPKHLCKGFVDNLLHWMWDTIQLAKIWCMIQINIQIIWVCSMKFGLACTKQAPNSIDVNRSLRKANFYVPRRVTTGDGRKSHYFTKQQLRERANIYEQCFFDGFQQYRVGWLPTTTIKHVHLSLIETGDNTLNLNRHEHKLQHMHAPLGLKFGFSK